MTELSSAPDPSLAQPLPGVPKSFSHWKHATLAGVLSLFFSGMGQLYNRQPRKAFVFALVTHLFGATLGHTRVLLTFPTMVVILLIILAWKIFVVAEASYAAATAKKPESSVPLPGLTYTVLVALVLAGNLIPTSDMVKEESGFSSFVVRSRSMCPTICIGDRVVADVHAYRAHPPQPGDIILMKHASCDALFLKVVGLPGDVLAPGHSGTILVNGQPFHLPAPCNTLTWEKSAPNDYSDFQATKVPEGTFFVIGDNLTDSYDSRIPEFGPVTLDMIRGKPLFLYWSPNHSRIGCSLR